MPKTPEMRAADKMASIFDSLSLNNELTAHFTMKEMTVAQQAQMFDFVMHIIAEFAEDDMEGIVSPQRAERFMVANAIVDTLRKEGYTMS